MNERLVRDGGVARPKAWLAWSSGKDSAWALHTVRLAGEFDVVALLTTVNRTHGRVAMHAVRESLLEMQAEAAGLPLVKVGIPSPCSNEIYERAMSEAMQRAAGDGSATCDFWRFVLAGCSGLSGYAAGALRDDACVSFVGNGDTGAGGGDDCGRALCSSNVRGSAEARSRVCWAAI